MGALANQSFVKMNGIGNEIVVVDLRARGGAIAPEEARAAATPQGAPYDQLMALYAPRTPGTDAFIRIYNNDGSEAGTIRNGKIQPGEEWRPALKAPIRKIGASMN